MDKTIFKPSKKFSKLTKTPRNFLKLKQPLKTRNWISQIKSSDTPHAITKILIPRFRKLPPKFDAFKTQKPCVTKLRTTRRRFFFSPKVSRMGNKPILFPSSTKTALSRSHSRGSVFLSQFFRGKIHQITLGTHLDLFRKKIINLKKFQFLEFVMFRHAKPTQTIFFFFDV